MTIQPVVTKTGPRQGYLLLDAALPSASRYSARWAIWRGGVLLSIYSKVVVTRLHQDRRPSAEGTDFFRGLRLALTHAILLTAGCLALLILTVMALARAGTVPSIQPHLQQLLTYGPIPTIANCVPRQFHHADCHIAVDGEDIALFVNTETGTITRIVVSGGQYRLGDLILAWGTPTGITRYGYGCNIFVFWGTRAAQVYTCALDPSSPVAYITYALTEQPLSSWRGFTTRP